MIFLFCFAFSQAQIVLPKSLEIPIQQALEKSKVIQNKEIEITKSESKRKAVKSLHIPRLEATAAYAYFDNRMTLDIPSTELPVTGYELFEGKTKFHNHGQVLHGGLIAKSVLFSGFQINRGAKALEEKLAADQLLIEADKDSIIADVVGSFDMLRYLQASQRLIDDSDERLQTEEKRVNKAIENGLAIPFERDKIKLARLELESKKVELQGSKKLLYRKINYLTNLSDIEIQQIVYDLEPLFVNNELTIEDKPELEALNHYKSATQYLLEKEKGDFWPKVAAFGGLTYSSLFNASAKMQSPYLNGQIPTTNFGLDELTLAPNWFVGVGLKWTIFAGTERKHKVKQAQLSVEQLNNKLEDSRDKLRLLLDKKMVEYQTKSHQIDIANQREIVAKNTLSQARKQYVNGLISISERLEAENDYVKAGQKKSKSLVEQRKSAIETLMVSGRLSQRIQYR